MSSSEHLADVRQSTSKEKNKEQTDTQKKVKSQQNLLKKRIHHLQKKIKIKYLLYPKENFKLISLCLLKKYIICI